LKRESALLSGRLFLKKKTAIFYIIAFKRDCSHQGDRRGVFSFVVEQEIIAYFRVLF